MNVLQAEMTAEEAALEAAAVVPVTAKGIQIVIGTGTETGEIEYGIVTTIVKETGTGTGIASVNMNVNVTEDAGKGVLHLDGTDEIGAGVGEEVGVAEGLK